MHEQQPDFHESQFAESRNRRVADRDDYAHMPPDLWRLLTDIRERGVRMEQKLDSMTTAFVKDDLGRPDYDGHRRAHSAMVKQAETIESFKMDATKKVLIALFVFIAGLMGSGFLSQLKEILT